MIYKYSIGGDKQLGLYRVNGPYSYPVRAVMVRRSPFIGEIKDGDLVVIMNSIVDMGGVVFVLVATRNSIEWITGVGAAFLNLHKLEA